MRSAFTKPSDPFESMSVSAPRTFSVLHVSENPFRSIVWTAPDSICDSQIAMGKLHISALCVQVFDRPPDGSNLRRLFDAWTPTLTRKSNI